MVISNTFNNNLRIYSEEFLTKLYDFKNKLTEKNPNLSFYLSFGNTFIQVFYKNGEKKHVLCYIDKINGNITKTNYKEKKNKVLSNINDTNSFVFNIKN